MIKMSGKKDRLVSNVCMFPDNPKQYTPDSLDNCAAVSRYAYFKNYVMTKSSQLQSSDYRSSTYDKLAKEKGFIDFFSDTRDGMIYLPKGVVVRVAVHEFVEAIIRDEGFVKLDLPTLFTVNETDLEEITRKFGDRVMGTSIDDKTYLKYASDPVLFAYLRGRKIPHELDPLRIYSPDKIYRNELSGEVDKFERPRMSYIEDYHIFTQDWKSVIKATNSMNRRFMDGLCDEWYVSCDVDKTFFEQNQDFFRGLISSANRPFLFNVLSYVPNYYTFEFKYSYLRSDGLPLIISNLQMDELNAKRFDIKVGDKHAYIIHGNATGRMEKVFIPLFDQALKMQKKGKKPALPLWLSPTQVRIIPVNNGFVEYCANLSEQYQEHNIRVDIDNRDFGLNKKIKNAEQEWIPYVVIIGQNEVQNRNISLRVRNEGEQKTSTDQSIEDLDAKLSGFPKVPTNIPLFVSKQTDLSFR